MHRASLRPETPRPLGNRLHEIMPKIMSVQVGIDPDDATTQYLKRDVQDEAWVIMRRSIVTSWRSSELKPIRMRNKGAHVPTGNHVDDITYLLLHPIIYV